MQNLTPQPQLQNESTSFVSNTVNSSSSNELVNETSKMLKAIIISFLVFMLSIVVLNATAQTVTNFNTPGTSTWVCPAGVTSIKVECWGAGGAGGGASVRNTAGGGGGGGAYNAINTVSVTPGNSYTIIVGGGGSAGTGNGTAGGNSTFATTTVVANGGGGGLASPTTFFGGYGAVGGSAGIYAGGAGSDGSVSGTLLTSGTGGGGAGSGSSGGFGGFGGTGGTPNGGAGGLGLNVYVATAGNSGSTIGGGGGGAARDNTSGSQRSGGAGANGQVKITYTIPVCVSPVSQPTSLVLSLAMTNITGSFTASSTTSNYLVVMTTSAIAPSNPINGTTYTVGSAALGGTIISNNSATTFNATGLTSGVQYWFWVFAYQAPTACTGIITYLTTSPLTNNATTVLCGGVTNVAIITSLTGSTLTPPYKAGDPSTNNLNWSALSWSLGHLPTSCEHVLLVLDRSATTVTEMVNINFDVANISVLNFTLRNISNNAKRIVFSTGAGTSININGNLTVECPGNSISNFYNRCTFTNSISTTVTGDVILGRVGTLTASNEGHSSIGSGGSIVAGQTYNLFGNMIFNPRGFTVDEKAVFNFDKAGTQYIYNYTRPLTTDTIQPVLFEDLRIGSTNATTLIMKGTMFDGYIELEGRAGITIGVNSVLDLPANYSLNVITGLLPSHLKMLSGSRLRLGGDKSINDTYGNAHGVAGSNYPNGLTKNTSSLDPTSTIEYYGNNTITQTIYTGVTYKNLIASNGVPSDMPAPTFTAATSHAQKITTGALTVNTSFNIRGFADVTLGTLGSSTLPVTSTGPLNILTDGGLFCNANVVSGTGAFTMSNYSTLGMGHAQGITASGNAVGNIQMTGGRTYNTTGNYVYNGIISQITNLGLPASAVNDLTIDNPTTVTIANDQLVNGVHLLKQGTFDIVANKITINGAGIINAVTGKMKADVGTVNMSGTSGTAQDLSGNWFVNKTINILTDANTTGIRVAPVPADTLLIAYALEYGTSTINSTITTNDNLTLLSRLAKTANFGNATSNFIAGKVNVERYMQAKSAWRLLATPVKIATSPSVSQAWREGTTFGAGGSALTSTSYGTRMGGPTGPYGAAGTMDDYAIRWGMKSYNAVNNSFINMVNANTTPIANNNGYFVFVRGDRANAAITGLTGITNLRIKGELRTGNQIFTVPGGKYQSIGNPFAARVDMRTVNKSNVSNVFIVWNPNSAGLHNAGAYETYLYNATSGNYQRVGDGLIRNYLESGEAIFVQSNVASLPGTITIKETDKANGSADVSRPGTALPSLDITLFAQDIDSSMFIADAIKMNFDSLYTSVVDNDDVRKVTNSYDNIGLKNGNNILIVERRGALMATDTIRFTLSGMRIAPYRLDIDPSVLNYPGLEATFVDKFLNTRTSLSFIELTSINFNVTADAASKAADRFMIVFKGIPAVRFTTISAKRNTDKSVKINWAVSNEVNVNNYEIETSIDGVHFTSNGIESAVANDATDRAYGKLDIAESENKIWYRIKANNAFGAPIYSAIAFVNSVIKTPVSQIPSISIIPTVITDGQVNLVMTNQQFGKYYLVITNSLGQVLKQSQINVDNDKFTYNLKTGLLSNGTYQLTVINDDGEKTSLAFIVK